MKRLLFSFALIVTAAFAQYKVEPASPLPSDLAAPFASGMGAGYKIVGPNGVYCEIWFKNALPKGEKNTEDAVAFPTIPQGSLVGAIRFPGPAADRRGQPLKPGLYTLRYSLQPNNGDHLGAAPQRDFLVLVPVADDKDSKAVAVYDELMAMSKKASGTPHPAVLSLEPASGSQFPSMNKEGDKDWALTVKIGGQPISVILIGKVEA